MTFKLSGFLLSIILISSANATGLLRSDLADPDALVAGDTVYFSGTSGGEELYFYSTSIENFDAIANGSGSKSVESPVVIYNPSKESGNPNNKYCFIVAPDLHNDGVNITLTFSAIFKPNTLDSCSEIKMQEYDYAIFYAKYNSESNNFGPPSWFSSPDNFVVGTNATGHFNNSTPRIDSERFTENGVTYWSYTWFTGSGNANTTVNMSTNSIIDNTFPNGTFNFNNPDLSTGTDSGITEAPNIFKRGDFYYLVYSEHLYYSSYQVYYKKARSITDLKTTLGTCRVTFNSWETKPTASSPGFNAGHGSVIKIGTNDYYFIYHIGHGEHDVSDGNPAVIRNTYVSKLVFVGDEIKQIPAPPFVGNGDHVGNQGSLPECIY